VKFRGAFETHSLWITLIVTSLLPVLLIAALWYVAARGLRKTPVMRFGKNRATARNSCA